MLQVLGVGGMGVVFRAEDPRLKRQVALKVMKPAIAASRSAKERFLKEAEATAAIEHDHIVTIYQVGEDRGVPFIAMRYLRGESLQTRLDREQRLDQRDVVRLGRQIALGLAAAHERGLIHRDIKPDNIWLDSSQSRVKIVDFGLVRSARDDSGLTQSGMVLGTPKYMAPEQANGETVDHRCDLFSLGSVLYHLASGKAPFAGGNLTATLIAVAQASPTPIETLCPNLNPELAQLIMRLLSKDRDQRPQTAAEVADALAQIEQKLEADPQAEAKPTPKIATKTSSDAAARRRPPRRRPALWLGTLFGAMLVAGVITIVTAQGTVTINIPDKMQSGVQVKVLSDSGQVAVLDKANNWTVKLSGGTYTLDLQGGRDAFKLKDNRLTVSRFGQTVVQIDYTPRKALVQANPRTAPNNSTGGWHGWPTDAPPPAIAPFDADEAQRHQQAWAQYLGVPVEYTNSLGMKFRLIPPGEFLMGSTPEEIEAALQVAGEDERSQQRIKSEAPQHKVILTQPVYVGVTEVTQSQYEQIMGANPSHFSATGEGKDAVANLETSNHPVEMVSWNDAAEFCAKLSQQEKLKPFYFRSGETVTPLDGTGYRLPTEAEWESACRAGTTARFWSGGEVQYLVSAAWFRSKSGGRTHAVGELKANPFGLSDVHGNVWEWVQDSWDLAFYGKFEENAANNPSSLFSAGSQRVIRGGHWNSTPSDCRSSARSAHHPTYRYTHIGFRVVLVVDAVRKAGTAPQPADLAADPYARDRAAAEWVISQRGSIVIQSESNYQPKRIRTNQDIPSDPFVVYAVDPTDIDQSDGIALSRLSQLQHLAILNLSRLTFDRNVIDELAQFRSLQTLRIRSTSLRSSQLTGLQQLKTLKTLELAASQIDDEGDFISNLPQLKTLVVRGTSCPTASTLAIHQHLHTIHFPDLSSVDNNDITKAQSINARLDVTAGMNASHKSLGENRVLKNAQLLAKRGILLKGSWDPARPDAFDIVIPLSIYIAECPHGMVISEHDAELLADLSCSYYRISAVQCMHVDQLISTIADSCEVFGVLDFSGSDLSDNGLMKCAQLGTLMRFDIRGTKVTSKAVTKLASLLPTCVILSDFGAFSYEDKLPEGSPADPYARDRAAAEWVISVGGKVRNVHYRDQGKHKDLKDIVSVEQLPRQPFYLQVVSLFGCQGVTSDALHVLGELPGLREIWLNRTKIDRRPLEVLANCPKLKRLFLANTAIHTSELAETRRAPDWTLLAVSAEMVDDNWRFVSTMPQIRELHVTSGGVKVTSLESLGEYPQLRSIHFPDLPAKEIDPSIVKALQTANPRLRITVGTRQGIQVLGRDPVAEAIERLRQRGVILSGSTLAKGTRWSTEDDDELPRDEVLSVLQITIPPEVVLTDEERRLISCLSYDLAIEGIEAKGMRDADAFLRILAPECRIPRLYVFGSDLTDTGLALLQAMKSLVYVDVSSTQVTRAGVEALKRHVPNCTIWSDFGTFEYEHKLPEGWNAPIEDPTAYR